MSACTAGLSYYLKETLKNDKEGIILITEIQKNKHFLSVSLF